MALGTMLASIYRFFKGKIALQQTLIIVKTDNSIKSLSNRTFVHRRRVVKKCARIINKQNYTDIVLDPVEVSKENLSIHFSPVSISEHSTKRVKGYEYLRL